MIISANSPFRRPPVILHPSQIKVFNAIRYSVDICEIGFERLEKELYEFAFKPLDEHLLPTIFADIWTIINNAVILRKVIVKHFEIDDNDPLFEKLRQLDGLRHSNQHLEDRIGETQGLNDLPPIYGIVSWITKKTENGNDGVLSVIYSGTVDKSISFNPIPPDSKRYNKGVNDIMFTGINREKRTSNFFETSIYINKIIEDIKLIIKVFEVQVETQFQNIDYSERHISDFTVQLQIKETTI